MKLKINKTQNKYITVYKTIYENKETVLSKVYTN